MPGMYQNQQQGQGGQEQMMDMNMGGQHPNMMNHYQQHPQLYQNNHMQQMMYQNQGNQGMMDPNAMNMNQEVQGNENQQI